MFSEKLKEIRRKKGLTQWRLAEIIGIHRQSLNRLEANEYPPSYPTLVALVKKAKVSPMELF